MKVENHYKDAIRAIELYEKATKKDLPDIMNRFNRNAAFRTVRKLKMATPASFERINPDDPRSKRGRYKNVIYKKLAKNGMKKGQGMKERARHVYRRRKSSRGFLKAIFFKIAKDLGAKSRFSGEIGPAASEARGIPATIFRLRGEIITGLVEYAAIERIDKAFRLGLTSAVKDMERHAKKKMDANAGKYSGTLT